MKSPKSIILIFTALVAIAAFSLVHDDAYAASRDGIDGSGVNPPVIQLSSGTSIPDVSGGGSSGGTGNNIPTINTTMINQLSKITFSNKKAHVSGTNGSADTLSTETLALFSPNSGGNIKIEDLFGDGLVYVTVPVGKYTVSGAPVLIPDIAIPARVSLKNGLIEIGT